MDTVLTRKDQKLAGGKPPSLQSLLAQAHARIDIVARVCAAVVEEQNPSSKAKLLGMLSAIANLDVDEDSRHA